MSLETMSGNPDWNSTDYMETVETLSRFRNLTFKVWCGDWCKDCRRLLPDFAAALSAAKIPENQIEQYPVEKQDDGTKIGALVDEYGITRIPTVVVERDGQELVRFVEDEDDPIAVYLATELTKND